MPAPSGSPATGDSPDCKAGHGLPWPADSSETRAAMVALRLRATVRRMLSCTPGTRRSETRRALRRPPLSPPAFPRRMRWLLMTSAPLPRLLVEQFGHYTAKSADCQPFFAFANRSGAKGRPPLGADAQTAPRRCGKEPSEEAGRKAPGKAFTSRGDAAGGCKSRRYRRRRKAPQEPEAHREFTNMEGLVYRTEGKARLAPIIETALAAAQD